MILPDTNLLVYAFNASAPLHKQASKWWSELLNGPRPVGVCWPVLQGFVRLLTSRRVVSDPYAAHEMFDLMDEWWKRPNVRRLEAGGSVFDVYRRLVVEHRLAGSDTTDALIAAHAIAEGGTLHTNDAGFSRFSELRHRNPLRKA